MVTLKKTLLIMGLMAALVPVQLCAYVQKVCRAKFATSRRVLGVTIPKTGTFMLSKCLAKLGIPIRYKKLNIPRWAVDATRQKNNLPPPNHFRGRYHIPTAGPLPHWWINWITKSPNEYHWTHVGYTPEFERYIDQHSRAMLLTIRDPRDMIVSFAHMVQTDKITGASLALELLLLDLVDGRQKNYIRWATENHDAYPVIWEVGVCAYYRQFLPFIKFKKCLVVRFEDLVGEQGGGSRLVQLATIQRIAEHIGKPVTLDQSAVVAAELFGGTGTFREGQIGSWKKYFTPAVKAAFKAAPGANQLLIELGYEKDDQW